MSFRLARLAIGFVVLLPACSSSETSGTTAPVQTAAGTDPLTTDLTDLTPLQQCTLLLANAVASMLDTNSLQATIDAWGGRGVTIKVVPRIAAAVSIERFNEGVDAAVAATYHNATYACADADVSNEVLGLVDSDPGWQSNCLDGQPPEMTDNTTVDICFPVGPDTLPPTVSANSPTGTSEPVPIGYEEGDGVWWFDEEYMPAPDLLKDVNDKWGNGFVPTPYSYCALPGSFSAPGEWGTDGEVTLGPDPLGGWGLRWPGEYHQYIVVLTGDDVRSSPVFSRLVATPGTTAGRSTVWATQDGWLMSNGSKDTCWFAWGISQEAPMGARRAFFSGILFMTSTSPWGD